MPATWQQLAFKNEHERDKHVHFDEPTHIYTVKGTSKGYISTTKFLHEFFPHFDADATIKKMMSSANWPNSKWYGKTAEEIKKTWNDSGKEASSKGTAMHLAIEQFLNGAEHLIDDEVKKTPEWLYFMNFWNKFGHDLEPFRTEWEVWTEEFKLTGSIDMIFKRKSDNTYVIYDWKRSKEIKTNNDYQSALYPMEHLPDTNYWHYTLQLNVYRWFLETYYGLKISDLYLIILHPDNKNFIRMKLNRLEKEIDIMMTARKRAIDEGGKYNVVLPYPGCEMIDD